MRGFKIECKTEQGEIALLQEENENKKVFERVVAKNKPFIEVHYLFKKNFAGRSMQNMFMLIPKDRRADELLKHIIAKMEAEGVKNEKDFSVGIIE